MIENPAAYEAAKVRRIKANARKGRVRRFDEAYPGLRLRIYESQQDKRLHLPEWLYDALAQWGGLTDKQAAVALKLLTPDVDKAWDAAIAEGQARASVTPWTAGRQEVTGTIAVAKWKATPYGVSLKALLVTTEGRRLWTTVPAAVPGEPDEIKGKVLRIRVTVQPKAGDPIFAFGSRPTLLQEAA